jgi:hypothetical protein
MAISKNTPIDFAKIATEMRSIVARWYNAQIKIIDPNIGDEVWDPATNTYTGTAAVEIYSGRARIQPIKNATMPDLGITQGAIESIRVQVPYDATIGLVRKGLQVQVVSGGEDATLQDLQFVVRSGINSSYGWNRTIECDADVKSVADGS